MTTDEIKSAFVYLDGLRDRGAVNMWGASPYLARFMRRRESEEIVSKVHTAWISSFDKTGTEDMDTRVEWARAELEDL